MNKINKYIYIRIQAQTNKQNRKNRSKNNVDMPSGLLDKKIRVVFVSGEEYRIIKYVQKV